MNFMFVYFGQVWIALTRENMQTYHNDEAKVLLQTNGPFDVALSVYPLNGRIPNANNKK